MKKLVSNAFQRRFTRALCTAWRVVSADVVRHSRTARWGLVNLMLITCAAKLSDAADSEWVFPSPSALGKAVSVAVGQVAQEQEMSNRAPEFPGTPRSARNSGTQSGLHAHEGNSDLVFAAAGDVSFGREVGQRLLKEPDYAPLAGVERLWSDADIRFVNLESTLSEQGGETQSPLQRLVFTGPPAGARALARAGVHVVSTANNHAWDYGPRAFFETLAHLDAAGVAHVGTGPDRKQAYRPAVFKTKGYSVAMFAVTHVWNYGPLEQHAARAQVAWANLRALEPALREARHTHDIVIVSYHGGAEYQDAPSDLTRKFMQAIMATGVDLVVGHHPHVLQGIGFFEGRPVFYSLGNLLFGRRKNHPWTRYGLLARFRLSADSSRSFAVCPYRIDSFEPDANMSQSERRAVLDHLRLAATATGGLVLGEPDSVGCAAVTPPKPRTGAGHPNPQTTAHVSRGLE